MEVLAFTGLDIVTLTLGSTGSGVVLVILVFSDWALVVMMPMSSVEVLACTRLDVVTLALSSAERGVVVVQLVFSDWAVVVMPIS